MGPGQLTLLFCGTFLVTAPLNMFCKNYTNVIGSIPLVQTANSVFVTRFGSLWLSTIYWGLLGSARLSGRHKNLVVNGTAKFCIQVVVFLMCNWWFFGVSIFERLNVATGGHCEASITMQSVSACKEALSKWVDGFDLSGHYFFLTTSCILVVHGCELRPRGVLIVSKTTARIWDLFRGLAAFIIIVWYLEFLVTSLFFHTVFEKLAALVGMMAVSLCFKVPDRYFPVQKETTPESDV